MLHVNLSHEKGCYGSETLTVVEGETWRPVQSTDALSWWVLIYLWSNTKKPKTFNASYLILIQWQACRPSHCYQVSIKKSRCSPYQDKLRRGLGFVWISCSITPTANTSPQVLNLRSSVVKPASHQLLQVVRTEKMDEITESCLFLTVVLSFYNLNI